MRLELRSFLTAAAILAGSACVGAPSDDRTPVHFAADTVHGSAILAGDDTTRVRAEVRAQIVDHEPSTRESVRQRTLGASRLTMVPGSVALRSGVECGALAIDSIAGLGVAYSEWLDASDLEVGPMVGAQVSLAACAIASAQARMTATFLSDGSLVEAYQLSIGGQIDQRIEWSAGWRLTRWDAAADDLAREGELFCGVRVRF